MRTRLAAARTSVVLRLAAGDEAFLHALYTDRRAGEVAGLGWDPAAVQAFVDMQFRAQQAGYGEAFPDASHWIVTVEGRPVGRLLVDRRPVELQVVDVVVLSSFRGLGIGTALMAAVMEHARAEGLPVRLTVAEHEQNLLAWYQRLGFGVVERTDVNIGMVWFPDPEPDGDARVG